MNEGILLPFDIEKAKNGAELKTADGLRKARIITYDSGNRFYPIVAMVEMSENVTIPYLYSNDGKEAGARIEFDLMCVPSVYVRYAHVFTNEERTEFYVNNHVLYNSQEGAESDNAGRDEFIRANPNLRYVGIHKINIPLDV